MDQGKGSFEERTVSWKGRVGKGAIVALLLWLLILDVVLLGVAADAFNKYVDGVLKGANVITPTVLLFALIDGGFLGAAVVLGFSHAYLFNSGSVGPAFVGSIFAWGINLLTLGFVCKEINIGNQGQQEKIIEYFVIIIGLFATIYMLILFGALHHPKLGVGYGSSAV